MSGSISALPFPLLSNKSVQVEFTGGNLSSDGGLLLLQSFLECPRPVPREVVLDFDPSEDPTHGQQEFAFFNGHYGGYCYLPLFVFARASGESEEFLVSAEMPESHGKEMDMGIARLTRVVEALRAQWPGVKVIFRADAWFATPELMDWLEDQRVSYAIAIPSNSVLQAKSAHWREQAEAAAACAHPDRRSHPGNHASRPGGVLQQLSEPGTVVSAGPPAGRAPRVTTPERTERNERADSPWVSGRSSAHVHGTAPQSDHRAGRTGHWRSLGMLLVRARSGRVMARSPFDGP